MRPMKRAVHIDFHTMPGIYNFNEKWDAKAFAERLSESKVKYVNVFARCNEGFSYYPTKVGTPYPGLKGDMLGDTIRECHKKDIGVTAYLNVGYDHDLARNRRDWRVVNKENDIQNEKDGILEYFIDMCYYHSGYRQYLLDMVKEINDNYDVDGFFLDCIMVKPCRCTACVDYMVSVGRDPLNDDDALLTSKEAEASFIKEVRKIIGPDKYLYFNGTPYYDAKGINGQIEIEGLPGGQGYDYFQANASYARNIEDKVIYMTARFLKSWADFGGLKTKASLENDVWDGIMNGCEVSVGDHQHPAETLERKVYDMIGEVYTEVEKYEKWTDNAKYVAEIGVLTQLHGIQGSSGCGCARMLGELKYSFDIINVNMDFSKYRLLILPDDILITPVLKEKLQKHLQSGKGIISSGFSGLNPEKTDFAMKEWDFEFDKTDESNYSYFKMKDENNSVLEDMRWSMYSHGILFKSDASEADYIKPYFNRHYDGVRGFWYTPPEKADGHSAVARKNNIYQICFKIFDAYYTSAMLAHKELVRLCIEKLMDNPLIKTENIPSTARVTLTENEKNLLLHVKVTFPEVRGLVDVIEEHQVLPAGSVVKIRGTYKNACTVPDENKINLEYEDGYTVIKLPQIIGYKMIALDKQN